MCKQDRRHNYTPVDQAVTSTHLYRVSVVTTNTTSPHRTDRRHVHKYDQRRHHLPFSRPTRIQTSSPCRSTYMCTRGQPLPSTLDGRTRGTVSLSSYRHPLTYGPYTTSPRISPSSHTYLTPYNRPRRDNLQRSSTTPGDHFLDTTPEDPSWNLTVGTDTTDTHTGPNPGPSSVVCPPTSLT